MRKDSDGLLLWEPQWMLSRDFVRSLERLSESQPLQINRADAPPVWPAVLTSYLHSVSRRLNVVHLGAQPEVLAQPCLRGSRWVKSSSDLRRAAWLFEKILAAHEARRRKATSPSCWL